MYLKHVSRLFSGMFQACFKIYTKHALNHHWNTLKHSWIILETCLKHAWNMLETCLEHAWNILEICLKHAWIMLETCLKHAWNMLERLWKHSWTLLMLWMTLITHNTSRQKKGVDGRTNKRKYWLTSSLLELFIAAKNMIYTGVFKFCKSLRKLFYRCNSRLQLRN